MTRELRGGEEEEMGVMFELQCRKQRENHSDANDTMKPWVTALQLHVHIH
ncbi:hypothetical protein JOB18_012751 [Solea senegalensis]|uniref:Uncharacterized protein n=1 Tax=Solea senegalensis TaxID=28829 RepID=A0AAV6SHJ3_SOLSE|nr:hypothetical protein JOB18_012751 [Solea senegalensis]